MKDSNTKHENYSGSVLISFDLLHIFKACGVGLHQQQQRVNLTLNADYQVPLISSLKQP
jgi:hypothetical protein